VCGEHGRQAQAQQQRTIRRTVDIDHGNLLSVPFG
jgi:hypothetical protein